MRPAPPGWARGRKWCRRQARACPGGLGLQDPRGLGELRARSRKGSGRGGRLAENLRGGRALELAAPDPGVCVPECLEIAWPQAGGRTPGAGRQRDSPSSPACLPPHRLLWAVPRTRPSPPPPPPPPLAGSARAAAARPSHVSGPMNVRSHVGAPQNGRRPQGVGRVTSFVGGVCVTWLSSHRPLRAGHGTTSPATYSFPAVASFCSFRHGFQKLQEEFASPTSQDRKCKGARG